MASEMKRKPVSLHDRLADEMRLSRAAAADTVDRVVCDILARIRSGRPVSLPGLGKLMLDRQAAIRFEPVIKTAPKKEGH